ncbi:MAG: autotransporter-associated beta strand repeat-containing protein [Gemmataceae bacterium]|nr:autotransporter-associated beta strand repeat-containing protein [Gemmataceae bacterium]MCI0742024.1 autotransporter-associated beta strand repeat-containing protein [Gemmataceae bacterium]
MHEWTGLGADNLWSNPQNWTNGAPTSDLSGDIDLVFHTNLSNAANLTTNNDIAGLVVDSITFDASAGMVGPTTFATGGTSTAGYTINGNTIIIDTGAAGQDPFGIDIANGVAAPAGLTETFNAGIALLNTNATFRSQQGIARLTFTGAIDLGTQTLTIDNTTGGGLNAALQGVTISGAISNGNLIKTGSGTLDLSGINSYANTTVNGGVVLVNTDTALGATSGTVTVNDPSRLQLMNGVTVVKTTLNLNSNQLLGGLGADGNTTNTFRGNVVLMAGAGGVAMGAGNSVANANTRLVVDGVISGATSTLSINGAGVVEFTKNNTYTGVTNHNGNLGFGALQIDAPAGLGAGGSGNESQFNRNGAGPTGSALWLNLNGSLQDGGGIGENINFAGSGVANLGGIRALGNSNVVLPGRITFIAGAPWFFGVDGAAGSITTTGVIDSQGANRALTKVGLGTLVIGGTLPNTYVGNTVVNAGVVSVANTTTNPLGVIANTVIINIGGTLRVETGVTVPNAVQINAGGTLAGSGTVNGTVTSTGGIISPGASTAILTVNNNVALDAASTFRAELNGTTVGSDYDQLDVNGTVTLGGATLHVDIGFRPAPGNSFVLINNDGADAIVGTFAGLSEGATVVFDGTFFVITYLGGTNNNDVVLTANSSILFFVDSSGLFEDFFGGDEKWLRGDVNQFGNDWYFILPTGDVFAWNRTVGLNGSLVASFGPNAWDNPELVVNATRLFAANPAELQAADQARAFFRASQGNFFFDFFGGDEKWIKGLISAKAPANQNNPWYFILPNGSVHEWDRTAGLNGTQVAGITPDVNVYRDPSLLFNAFQNAGVNSGGFDETRDFFFASNIRSVHELFENFFGADEKWFRGNEHAAGNDWYFLLPNGDLFEWNGQISATGNLLANLGVNAWNNIERVVENFKPTLTGPQQNQLIALDMAHRLFRTSNDFNFFRDLFGQDEKWLRGKDNSFGNAFYFILPNGNLFEWNGSAAAAGNQLATVPISVYDDPLVLADAYADGSVLNNAVPLDPFQPNAGEPGDRFN